MTINIILIFIFLITSNSLSFIEMNKFLSSVSEKLYSSLTRQLAVYLQKKIDYYTHKLCDLKYYNGFPWDSNLYLNWTMEKH